MEEDMLTFEMVEEVNLDGVNAIASLRDFLRELANDFTAYARQFSVAAAMVFSLTEASAVTTFEGTEESSPVMEYVLTEENLPTKAEIALEKLLYLDDDWDGYGAPAISRKSIDNCNKIIRLLSRQSADSIEVLPTEYGGVQIKKILADGSLLSSDFGDDTMSYYIEKDGKATYFPFLPYTQTAVEKLAGTLV